MARKPLVVYYSDSCPACDEAEPLLKKLGREHKVPLKFVDTDNCPPGDEFCSTLDWVPTVAECDIKGTKCKEVPLEKVEAKIKRMGKKR